MTQITGTHSRSQSRSRAGSTMPSEHCRDCGSSATTERWPQGRDFRGCSAQRARLWWIKLTRKEKGPPRSSNKGHSKEQHLETWKRREPLSYQKITKHTLSPIWQNQTTQKLIKEIVLWGLKRVSSETEIFLRKKEHPRNN